MERKSSIPRSTATRSRNTEISRTGSIRKRSSSYSRLTQSSRVTISALTPARAKDTRPINDKNWQAVHLKKVQSFLAGIPIARSVLNKEKYIKPVTLNSFVGIFSIFSSYIFGSSFIVTMDNYIEIIPEILRHLQYPGINQVSASFLKTANAPHSLPQVIAIFTYLHDVVEPDITFDFAQHVDVSIKFLNGEIPKEEMKNALVSGSSVKDYDKVAKLFSALEEENMKLTHNVQLNKDALQRARNRLQNVEKELDDLQNNISEVENERVEYAKITPLIESHEGMKDIADEDIASLNSELSEVEAVYSKNQNLLCEAEIALSNTMRTIEENIEKINAEVKNIDELKCFNIDASKIKFPGCTEYLQDLYHSVQEWSAQFEIAKKILKDEIQKEKYDIENILKDLREKEDIFEILSEKFSELNASFENYRHSIENEEQLLLEEISKRESDINRLKNDVPNIEYIKEMNEKLCKRHQQILKHWKYVSCEHKGNMDKLKGKMNLLKNQYETGMEEVEKGLDQKLAEAFELI